MTIAESTPVDDDGDVGESVAGVVGDATAVASLAMAAASSKLMRGLLILRPG